MGCNSGRFDEDAAHGAAVDHRNLRDLVDEEDRAGIQTSLAALHPE